MTERALKAPKQKEFTSTQGNKYMFQAVRPSIWMGIADEITNDTGKLLHAKAMPALLEHVVVQPSGLTPDDFDEWSELNEVTAAAFQFQSIN